MAGKATGKTASVQDTPVSEPVPADTVPETPTEAAPEPVVEGLAQHRFSLDPDPVEAAPVAQDDTPVQVLGKIPVAAENASGFLRFTAVVDATFKNGRLESIEFTAAQYTAFPDDKGRLAIQSAFSGR